VPVMKRKGGEEQDGTEEKAGEAWQAIFGLSGISC
jgi:hypothetical protein